MKLERWALIAEIIGGAAIIVTLAFLAFETRSNTNAVRAQTYQTFMAELNDYREMIASDVIYQESRVKARSEGWERMSLQERQAFRMPEYIRWGIYESAFFANDRGVMGESEWSRFEAGICRAYASYGMFWDAEAIVQDGYAPMSEVLTPEFFNYVNTTC